MKAIVDKLLERQQKLLGRLDDPRPKQSKKTAVGGDERALQQESEARALDAALAHLAEGEVQKAKELLLPYEAHATLVRVLTTLANISAVEGNFERAVELLKRAEALDPADSKVWRLLAQMHSLRQQHNEEVHYRRRLAFVDPNAPAQAFVDLVSAIAKATPSGKTTSHAEVRRAADRMANAAGTSAGTELRFAEAQYSLTGMAKDARARYAAAAPPAEDERDVSATWMRMVDWCTRVDAPLKRLVDGGIPSQRPSIAELSDVYLFRAMQWTPIVDEGRIALQGHFAHRIRLRSEDPHSPLLMNRPSNAELRLPRSMQLVDEPALLIGGIDRYYHNAVAHFSSLAIAEMLGVGASLPLVVNDDLGEAQLEMLALLGYGDRQLIRVSNAQPLQFRRLVVPSRLVHGGRWVDPLVPDWYRRKLSTSLDASAKSKRLYIASESPTIRLANEQNLVALLEQHGFQAVRPSTLSVRQQIDLFSQASHIVGPAEESLTNMMFSAPGACVAVLYNRQILSGDGDLYFDALAKASGHDFHAIACAPHRAREGERWSDQELAADLEAIRAILR